MRDDTTFGAFFCRILHKIPTEAENIGQTESNNPLLINYQKSRKQKEMENLVKIEVQSDSLFSAIKQEPELIIPEVESILSESDYLHFKVEPPSEPECTAELETFHMVHQESTADYYTYSIVELDNEHAVDIVAETAIKQEQIQKFDHNNETHECTMCNQTFERLNGLKKHLLYAHNINVADKPFKCSICDKFFSVKENLRIHHRTHRDQPKTYKCSICDKEFTRKYNCKLHQNRHTTIDRFECDFCGKEFSLKHSLRNHLKSHVNNFPDSSHVRHPCTMCPATFNKSLALQIHIDRLHNAYESANAEAKTYECYLCERRFLRLINLRNHFLLFHVIITGHQCPMCNRQFSAYTDLRQHIQITHRLRRLHHFECAMCDGKRISVRDTYRQHCVKVHGFEPAKQPKQLLECSNCKGNFYYKSIFLKHLSQCTDTSSANEVPSTPVGTLEPAAEYFKCYICTKQFGSLPEINKHMLLHTVTTDDDTTVKAKGSHKFECKICLRHFKAKVYLKRHMGALHKEIRKETEDDETHECDVCHNYFNLKYLKQHKLVHLRLRPPRAELKVKCKLCEQMLNKSSMRKHLYNKHSGLKPFKCEICTKTFAQVHVLRQHMTVHTDATPFKCNICNRMFKFPNSLKKHVRIMHQNE